MLIVYHIESTYVTSYDVIMEMFNDKDEKFRTLSKIILDIEEQKDIIEWADASIDSCMWTLEEKPEIGKKDRALIVGDLRENLNKKEAAFQKLTKLKSKDLRDEMIKLNMGNSADHFLESVEETKKKYGIDNLWKHEQNKKDAEYIKKHPEKVGTLHVTEDSLTFKFGSKKKD